MTTQEKQKLVELIKRFCEDYQDEVNKNYSIDDDFKNPQFYELEKKLIGDVKSL